MYIYIIRTICKMIKTCFTCVYIYSYIKLKPDVHMYTHMCMYRFPYYVHVTGLCTNYIIHGHHWSSWSHDVWCMCVGALHDNIANCQ